MGRAATSRGLAYRVKSVPAPGGLRRPMAIAACHGCGAEKQLPVYGPANNPEKIQTMFRQDGWEFDAWNARGIVCPQCQQKRRERRHGDSGAKGLPPSTTGAEIVKLTASTTASATPKPPTPIAVPVAPVPAEATRAELTVEERSKVRDMLVGTFDERLGQYSEGWSDARVARECGGLLPKLVADLREVAFGPLKSIAELDVLHTELKALAERDDALDTKARALEAEAAKLRRDRNDLAEKIEHLAARIEGVAHDLGVRS